VTAAPEQLTNVDLARRIAETEERLAEPVPLNPEERLAADKAEQQRRWGEQAKQRARNRSEYVQARDDYLDAREEAWNATRTYTEAIERAAMARREVERFARREGARVTEDGQVEQIPDPCYVTAERNRHLRELRSLARSASTIARW
jgi:hypothetical protein